MRTYKYRCLKCLKIRQTRFRPGTCTCGGEFVSRYSIKIDKEKASLKNFISEHLTLEQKKMILSGMPNNKKAKKLYFEAVQKEPINKEYKHQLEYNKRFYEYKVTYIIKGLSYFKHVYALNINIAKNEFLKKLGDIPRMKILRIEVVSYRDNR